MKRRDFLKKTAITTLAVSNANAISIASNSPLNDDNVKMSACHFGAFYGKNRNKRFESIKDFEGDFYPSPLTQGILARTYSTTRVKNPCVRKSFLEKGHKSDRTLRGKEEFVEVSWEKAFDLVAGELKRVYKEYGQDAIYGGNFGWHCVGTVNNPERLLKRMLNISGGFVDKYLSYSRHCIKAISPYITEDESSAKQTSWENILQDSEVVVFWSCDPINTNQVSRLVPDHESYKYMQKLKKEAKKRGVKIICIDPVFNNTANYFDAMHVAINPTTDVALMLAIANYLIKNGLHKKDFLKKYTHGFEHFEKYVLGQGDDKLDKTPLWASNITGVSVEEIESLAKLFISKKTMLMSGWSMQRAHHGEQPVWCLITLASMLGQIGTKGGGYGFGYQYSEGGVPSSIKTTAPKLDKMPLKSSLKGEWSKVKNKKIPVSRIVHCLENPNKIVDFNCKKILYPDLKLCYWAGGNPFVHHQDTNRMKKAWQKLETFIVNECFWTPTAKMADIVLPATIEQERDDITRSYTNKYIFAMKKVAKPYENAKDDFVIFGEILKRFSKKHYEAFTENKTQQEWIEYFYKKSYKKAKKNGVNMPEFNAFWEKGFVNFETLKSSKDFIKLGDFIQDPIKNKLQTKSGKIEIRSDIIGEQKYKDCFSIPTWFEPHEYLGSKKAKEFPLHLITPHPKYRLHSQLDNTWMRDLEEVKGREPIWINPKNAKKRGIKNGDIVKVYNDRGSILGGAILTNFVKEDVVRMQEGAWWNPQNDFDDHGSVNMLTLDKPSSELGMGNQVTALVQIEKYSEVVPKVTAFDVPKILK